MPFHAGVLLPKSIRARLPVWATPIDDMVPVQSSLQPGSSRNSRNNSFSSGIAQNHIASPFSNSIVVEIPSYKRDGYSSEDDIEDIPATFSRPLTPHSLDMRTAQFRSQHDKKFAELTQWNLEKSAAGRKRPRLSGKPQQARAKKQRLGNKPRAQDADDTTCSLNENLFDRINQTISREIPLVVSSTRPSEHFSADAAEQSPLNEEDSSVRQTDQIAREQFNSELHKEDMEDIGSLAAGSPEVDEERVINDALSDAEPIEPGRGSEEDLPQAGDGIEETEMPSVAPRKNDGRFEVQSKTQQSTTKLHAKQQPSRSTFSSPAPERSNHDSGIGMPDMLEERVLEVEAAANLQMESNQAVQGRLDPYDVHNISPRGPANTTSRRRMPASQDIASSARLSDLAYPQTRARRRAAGIQSTGELRATTPRIDCAEWNQRVVESSSPSAAQNTAEPSASVRRGSISTSVLPSLTPHNGTMLSQRGNEAPLEADDSIITNTPAQRETQIAVGLARTVRTGFVALMGRKGFTGLKSQWKAEILRKPNSKTTGDMRKILEPQSRQCNQMWKFLHYLKNVCDKIPQAPDFDEQYNYVRNSNNRNVPILPKLCKQMDIFVNEIATKRLGPLGGTLDKDLDKRRSCVEDLFEKVIPMLVLTIDVVFSSGETEEGGRLGDFEFTKQTLHIMLRLVGWTRRLATLMNTELEVHPLEPETETGRALEALERENKRRQSLGPMLDIFRTKLEEAWKRVDIIESKPYRQQLYAQQEQMALATRAQRERDEEERKAKQWRDFLLAVKKHAERPVYEESRGVEHTVSGASTLGEEERTQTQDEEAQELVEGDPWSEDDKKYLLRVLRHAPNPNLARVARQLDKLVEDVEGMAELMRTAARQLAIGMNKRIPDFARTDED